MEVAIPMRKPGTSNTTDSDPRRWESWQLVL